MINKRFTAMLAVLLLLCSSALADGISFNGTVIDAESVRVTAPIGGTAESVKAAVGTDVSVGDVLLELQTTKVYASEAGTVTGIFGAPGENTETVASRYGAVLYVEGPVAYTITASTDNAYNTTANKYAHVGETVYLVSRTDGSRTGEGIISAIEGTDYTVQVTSGDFLLGENADVYREESHKAITRIGRGEISRNNPTAYSGTGSIVSIAVKDGDTVEKGQLLFETLTGEFDGYYMLGSEVLSSVSGVLAEMKVEEGATVTKGDTVAVVYTSMRIEANVNEEDLSYIKVDDHVLVELSWNQDDDVTYDGVITMISSVATQSENSVSYKVYIDFTPDEGTRYGMSAVISTLEDADGTAQENEDAGK